MGLLLLMSTPTSAASGGDKTGFAYHLVYYGDIRFEAIALSIEQIITEVI
jgi:hypothetical protein